MVPGAEDAASGVAVKAREKVAAGAALARLCRDRGDATPASKLIQGEFAGDHEGRIGSWGVSSCKQKYGETEREGRKGSRSRADTK